MGMPPPIGASLARVPRHTTTSLGTGQRACRVLGGPRIEGRGAPYRRVTLHCISLRALQLSPGRRDNE